MPSPKDPTPTLKQGSEELEREVIRLRAENERLRCKKQPWLGRLDAAMAWFAIKIGLGKDLRESTLAWLEAASTARPVPKEETANLFAAVVRRVSRIGIWRLAVALGGFFTAGILIYQAALIRNQNTLIQNQVEEQRLEILISMINEGRPTRQSVFSLLKIQNRRGTPADLTAAKLGPIDLSGADLHGARLVRARLQNARLVDVDLSDADLRGALLEEAELSGANLHGANLHGADLRGADLVDARNVTQDQIELTIGDTHSRIPINLTPPEHWRIEDGPTTRDAILRVIEIQKEIGQPVRLAPYTDLEGLDLSGVDLRRAQLNGVNLSATNLSGADLRRTSLSGADLRRADLTTASLHETNFQRANLQRANLKEANLYSALLNRAKLNEANLSRASLFRADLHEADLAGAEVYGADLRGALKVTQTQLESANGDRQTKLPKNLQRPRHWNVKKPGL